MNICRLIEDLAKLAALPAGDWDTAPDEPISHETIDWIKEFAPPCPKCRAAIGEEHVH